MPEPHQKERKNEAISSHMPSSPSDILPGGPWPMGVLFLTPLRHHEDKYRWRSLYFWRFQTGEDEILH